jgi:hypothetical protein
MLVICSTIGCELHGEHLANETSNLSKHIIVDVDLLSVVLTNLHQFRSLPQSTGKPHD